MVMEKKRFPSSMARVAKIASFLLLFLLAPMVPSSLRPPYLYLLFNALVVALSVEAGFLAAISGPRDDKHARPLPAPASTSSSSAATTTATSLSGKPGEVSAATKAHLVSSGRAATTTGASPYSLAPKASALEAMQAAASLANGVGVKAAKKKTSKSKKMKRCPSRASIFFIGGGDGDAVDATVYGEDQDEWKDAAAGGEQMSKQELFTKAEAFIGNFYKQLKMQREESWKKLQDITYYHHYKTKAL
ncbi:hypothetical protein GUJ93_ZPchr0001g30077 [Zizania palustris]|uniref:DUF4408 domain-containing protein n=1 Tax=Zizania palustris TaxID=103762 RepID=A0A8J5RRF4_ZIZPA|nr:hypothetical protein GUJ93_ZPchr0001g30077 [Zizania palustris]